MKLTEIQERYSVRNFSDKSVPDEIIENILEAARLAPSWANVQPWHFIAVRDSETKNLLSQLSLGQRHVITASAVIVCCGDKRAWERKNYKAILAERPGVTEERIETLLSNPAFNHKLKGESSVTLRCVEEVTYATAYMTLEAHKNGVGCCVVGLIGNELTETVPDLYQEVRSRLQLPEELMIVTLLPVGYSADTTATAKLRKPKENVISYETFGNKTR